MKPKDPYRPLLVHDYERYLVDQDAESFLQRVSSRYTIGGLERVATSADRAARRGAVLALGRLADFHSNSVLGRALVDADRGVRTLAEHGIRRLWMRIGTTSQRRHLYAIAELLENKHYDRAAQISTALVEDAPGWPRPGTSAARRFSRWLRTRPPRAIVTKHWRSTPITS